MPVYEYQCQNGHVMEQVRTIDDRERPVNCFCGYVSTKVILSAPRVFGDYQGYESPATGRWVEGKRARIEDLRRSGCRPYEEGERKQFEYRRAAAERELDKTADAAVDMAFEALAQHDEGSDARNQLMRG